MHQVEGGKGAEGLVIDSGLFRAPAFTQTGYSDAHSSYEYTIATGK
jgi:hypothetical protein